MDKNAEAALLALKKNYIRSLPDKINDLEATWQSYLANNDENVIEEAYRKAHSLAGSGATFGQQELGQKSKSLELFIKEKLENGSLLDEISVKSIESDIEELRSIVQAISLDDAGNGDAASDVKVMTINKTNSVRPLSILVVDDDDDMRLHVVKLLETAGHKIIQATNGKQAVDAFQKFEPELIFMDVVLPDFDGIEATRRIKNSAGNRFVPVIFVTSIDDMQKLAGFIDSGGDDFLVKPVEPLILSTKIQAFSRINEMYQKLDEYQRQTEEELETSKYLLENLLELDIDNLDNVQCWAKSPGHFSGDLRLVKQLDSGELLILLCDFTGHGLPAAIGTIFVADLFRSMTKKAIDAQIILDEINDKMNQILPTGRYCAAVMILYTPEYEHIKIWNCGLPSVFLLNHENKIVEQVDSAHVPLGVLGGAIRYEPTKLSSKEFKSVVLFSDGITEAENPQGQMYGEDVLTKKIEEIPVNESVFQSVKADVERFMEGSIPTDDISFIVLDL